MSEEKRSIKKARTYKLHDHTIEMIQEIGAFWGITGNVTAVIEEAIVRQHQQVVIVSNPVIQAQVSDLIAARAEESPRKVFSMEVADAE